MSLVVRTAYHCPTDLPPSLSRRRPHRIPKSPFPNCSPFLNAHRAHRLAPSLPQAAEAARTSAQEADQPVSGLVFQGPMSEIAPMVRCGWRVWGFRVSGGQRRPTCSSHTTARDTPGCWQG